MALHPDFPTSPHLVVDPSLRWFPADEALRLLEALELVAVGIEGKRALWRSLAVASEDVPELQGVDYEHLLQRSEEQQRRVETVRLEAAKAAFVAGS